MMRISARDGQNQYEDALLKLKDMMFWPLDEGWLSMPQWLFPKMYGL